MSIDITEEAQVQTHLYKQDILDKILQIRLHFFFFFLISINLFQPGTENFGTQY